MIHALWSLSRVVQLRRLMRALATVQTRQSLCCLHSHSLEVDEDTDEIIDLKPSRICQHVRLKYAFLQNCMFDSRPGGRGFESQRRQCVVHVSES